MLFLPSLSYCKVYDLCHARWGCTWFLCVQCNALECLPLDSSLENYDDKQARGWRGSSSLLASLASVFSSISQRRRRANARGRLPPLRFIGTSSLVRDVEASILERFICSNGLWGQLKEGLERCDRESACLACFLLLAFLVKIKILSHSPLNLDHYP